MHIPAENRKDSAATDHRKLHDHNFLGSDHEKNASRTLWVVGLTAIMMVGEIAAGIVTGSMALLADGIHMATHAGALGVAAFAYSYAKRHVANPRFTFGTGKVGDLAGFASALVLGIFAVGIAVESTSRFFEPINVAFGDATVVAVLGLIVNLVSAALLSGGHHHHHHHGDHDHGHAHGHDNNLRSAYLHVLADALTSVLAIVALLAGNYLGIIWLDPVMGLVGALVIARWSWSLMRDTAAVLLDSSNGDLANRVADAVEAPGGAEIVDLHVWRVGPESHAGIVSVQTDERTGVDEIRDRIAQVHAFGHLSIELGTRNSAAK
ncbi:CDF family Co(II)/Ni(II) efflux transporter DmeF [Pacificimonas flava]|uniref:Cobalt-zinc-cadmium resistance protein CzcD n=1 Tax=Pacificimonas flava TaxID=1234595 RepID=M2SDC2_9SPHN|nr:CDF family Co(II)/Ni(II) efflux transporter DmeF [Pacificimonas flava]EMD83335.1 Cobalt-zinc-cadmium resistance protein CzcD [Pacificimonas flava]MBB5279106.1 cation diffusion facilitator family transporter [Pacificimonas flava]